MPRYYFEWDEQADDCGANLVDDRAAHRYALRLAGEVLRDLAHDAPGRLHWRLDISRADRTSMASLAMELQPAASAEMPARPAVRPRRIA